ncbi:MAG: PQQ-dependent sugar dehydrogenase [Planctomycetales bacterium]|nr:PQQ-dependent sugar dehydrogenase [Planctomycetales bacterium]
MGARTRFNALGFVLLLAWAPLSCLADDVRRDGDKPNGKSPESGEQSDEQRPYGLDTRVPWTTSQVVGAPEPPLPYIAVQQFKDIAWERPMYVKAEPGTNWLIVIQQGGEDDRPTKLLRVEDRPDASETSVFWEVPKRMVYSVEFHPDYEQNGYVYVFSNGITGQPNKKNRVSRFTVSRQADASEPLDADSELIILEWFSEGHDGGDMVFAPDGLLYITSGDGTSDSDEWMSAQDITGLQGGVLRIDVRQATAEQPYTIPADNPFLDIPDARGEFWAIGLRNPWRMGVDRKSGQIWVGNNGQDLWETVHLIGRGENYGWSVYEGSHPFYVNRQLGPGKLTRPTFEHHHIESRSLTGGVVYEGQKLPELTGAYLYGDYSTGKIWAARHDGSQVTWHAEIADTTIQIAAFCNSHQGEILLVDHAEAGGIYRLEVNPDSLEPDKVPEFPRKLSETGLFDSVAEHRVAPGVISYSVNTPGWNDGAAAERYLAIPDDEQIEYGKRDKKTQEIKHNSSRGWNFPDGAVLLQTLSLDVVTQGVAAPRRIETRMLTRQQGEWAAYSYLWNAAQDEALLVEASGQDLLLETLKDNAADGQHSEQRTWRVPARAECLSCHSRAVNFVLGMTEVQMNKEHDYGTRRDNQLRTLEHIGLFTEPLPKRPAQLMRLVDPYDPQAPLETRVKSYLHTNCAGCHVGAGGGNSRMLLEFTTPLEEMRIISEFPQHATFGITHPQIVAPGDPSRSVMLARVSRRGVGQMPPLFTQRVDQQAVELLQQWMAGMEPDRKFVKNWSVEDLSGPMSELHSGRSFERGEALFASAGCGQCHRMHKERAGIGPNLTDVAHRRKPSEILESIIDPSASIDDKYAATQVVTVDGEVVIGRVESEDDKVLVVRGNESFDAPRTILKSDIEVRSLSKVSTMPSGTVNHLELEEILDLLAYLLAEGDAQHAVFQP